MPGRPSFARAGAPADAPRAGAHRYGPHFGSGETPPGAGLSNLARCDGAMRSLPTAAERTTISSTTGGVTPNADGSPTLYLQLARPAAGRAANRPPAPRRRGAPAGAPRSIEDSPVTSRNPADRSAVRRAEPLRAPLSAY